MFTDPSPPSPFPPPPSPPLPDPSLTSAAAVSSGDTNPHSGTPSILIIISIIALVIAASASIHLLLRLISRFRSSSSSSSPISSPSSPSPLLRSTSSETTATDPPPPSSDREKLIASLPLFSLATSVAAFRKSSSLDCAVCLSNFRPQDELRLLPACRHAFHSQCVDTWLRSTPSCPLCRASIHLPAMPPPAASPADSSRSGSFRVELGSVSRRRGSENGIATPNGRSYSLGSSFEYLVEEEVEAVLERLRVAPEGKVDNGGGGEVEIVDAGGGRGWIRDCVDRLTSSASSSFNSLRFSGRIGSHRFDSGVALATAAGGGRSWDLEANNFMEWEEESGFASLYRWLVGI